MPAAGAAPAVSAVWGASSGSPPQTTRSAASASATMSGRPDQNPSPTNTATSTGASAGPRPRSALRYNTARSARSGKNPAANVLREGTAIPNPNPRLVVATSNMRYGRTPSPIANWLANSNAM